MITFPTCLRLSVPARFPSGSYGLGPLRRTSYGRGAPRYSSFTSLPPALLLLDSQGNVRPYREWQRQPEYTLKYRKYCEQSTFLARQLEDFLGALQQAGVLESARVVVHGDYGSRLKRYSVEPTLRELLDSFSAMLAICQPGPGQARIDSTKGSLLSLLRQSEGRPAGTEQDLNNVFLGGTEDSSESDIANLRAASILDLWKE